MAGTLCTLLIFLSHFIDTRATVTLTSTVDGRQTACLGEVVTYTCNVTQGGAITWTASPILLGTAVRFLSIDPSGSSHSCSDPSSPVECDDLDYQATITSVGTLDMNGLADLMSTFRFTLRAELNGTVVQCSAVTATSTPSATQTLNSVGLPSPPRTPSYTVQQYSQDSVMLRVQWQSPQEGGGAPVSYTVTVNPGSTQIITTATNTSLSAIPYNVNHTISIVATNCNGSSSAVMETIRIVNCSEPTTPGNGSIRPYQNTTEGALISFRCDSRFVPNKTITATCGADGRWNPDPITHVCTFDCGHPKSPRNGSVGNPTGTTERSLVVYRCDQNLVPERSMTSVCTVNGWSPNPAELVCNVVNCDIPDNPVNGSIEPPQSTLFGSIIVFGCDPGFIPAERMTATCMLNGTWTLDPGTLVCNVSAINCSDPTPASGVTVRPYNTTAVGSIIYYQCQQQQFVLSSFCKEDGMWSRDPSQHVCKMKPTVMTDSPANPTVGLGTEEIALMITILVQITVLIGVVAIVLIIVMDIWCRKNSTLKIQK